MDDDRIQSTKNRVFVQEIPIGKNNPISLKTNSDYVYRVTGMNQIEDILNTGYVRSKEVVKGGHKKELFWSRGGENLFYFDKRPVLEAPYSKVQNGQIGAIPIEDLTAIWMFNNEENKYVNCLDYYINLREEYYKPKGKSR